MIAQLKIGETVVATLEDVGRWSSPDGFTARLLEIECPAEASCMPFGIEAVDKAAKLLKASIEWHNENSDDDEPPGGEMGPEAGITFSPEDREALRAAGYTDEQMDATELQSRTIPWNDVVDENGKPYFEDEIERKISSESPEK